MHEIPKQDIKNEQLLRLALHQACNPDLSGSSRKSWFLKSKAIHKSRSSELIQIMEEAANL